MRPLTRFCAKMAIAAVPAATALAQPSAKVPYVDAHSHIIRAIGAEAEISRFRKAGLAGLIIIDADEAALRDFAERAPGYAVPFVSVARTRDLPGLRLDGATAAAFEKLYASGKVCGLGEIPTRLDPNPEPSDEAALTNSARSAIYALADRLGAPVNIHTYAESPAVADAVTRIAADHPRMNLILAHAGWGASAEVIGRLMAAHPNIYADLSVRLDPAKGSSGGSDISILEADGSLIPEWRALIERFPERFMFGLDVTGTERPDRIEALVAGARKALGALPPAAEHAVAHGNIERLVQGCARRFSRAGASMRVVPESPRGQNGAIVAVAEEQVVLERADGVRVTVPMSRGWIVGQPRVTRVDTLRKGDFVASINTDVDAGTGKARELRVFERGYRPELGTHAMPDPGVSITHGFLAASMPSPGGRKLSITYSGGGRTLLVASDLKVTIYDLRDRAALRPGAKVGAVTRRGEDGIWRAGRLVLQPD